MRCSHRDQREEYTGHSLSIEDWQQWLTCFCEWRQRQTRQWKPREHACTSDCEFFQHRNIYVCLENGHAHLCNELACDRLETIHDEHRVCTLTALTYHLPFADEYERGGGRTNEQRIGAAATNTRVLAKPSGKTSKKRGGADGLSHNTPTPSPTPSPVAPYPSPSPPPQRLSVAPEQEPNDVVNLVRHLMSKKTPPAMIQGLADHILDAYRSMRLSSWWTVADAKLYPLEQHTLTHLYAMRRRTEDELYNGRPLVRALLAGTDFLLPLDKQPYDVVSYQARDTSRKTTQRFIGYMKRVLDAMEL